MSMSYGLTFGALADDIEVQLRRQGLTLGSKEAMQRIQRWADEITNLGIHQLLTGAERDRARRRLIKEIKSLVRVLPAPPSWRAAMAEPSYSDRLALAVCVAVSLPGDRCRVPCDQCRRESAAAARELAQILRERYGGSSATADWLDGVGTFPPIAPVAIAPVTMATEQP